MKTAAIAICAVLFALTIYVVQKDFRTPEAGVAHISGVQTVTVDEKHTNPDTPVATAKKKCACCSKKLSPAQAKAKQRQQARETWARQIIAKHGYQEGMKRITDRSPTFAKQMRRILDREKRLGQPLNDLSSVPE